VTERSEGTSQHGTTRLTAVPKDTVPVSLPAHALPRRSPRQLLASARHGLAEASHTIPPGQRYATAHVAALRAAAAVVAARARPAPSGPGRRRVRPVSVWVLLARVAPELGEWATFFATAALKRAAAEAGIPHVVSIREADDLVRDAERFCQLAEVTLGRVHPSSALTLSQAG